MSESGNQPDPKNDDISPFDQFSKSLEETLQNSQDPACIPQDHSLRHYFRQATRRAFSRYRALHHPEIERHIAEEVLGDFVHMDRIYRLKNEDGQRLTDITDMAIEKHRSAEQSGIERDLEVHQHVGDYALFMAGLFPEFIEPKKNKAEKPLLAYVGSILKSLNGPKDYYIVEGSSAYSHVSHLYKRLDPNKSGIFHRLASRFDEYLEVLSTIRVLLAEPAADGPQGEIIV